MSSAELGWPSYIRKPVQRWRGSVATLQQDCIAEEAPVALVYNGVPHVVMLTTPLDLDDFAVGFSVTEGIVRTSSEIRSIRVYRRTQGIEVHLQIPEAHFEKLAEHQRNLSGRSGCGMCGTATLANAVRPIRPLSARSLQISADDLIHALSDVHEMQRLNELTGAVHAAAWVEPGQGIVSVREDVGRHNALDKLIGALLRGQRNLQQGFAVVTSRASFELVQKCMSVGIGMLAAMSAPTALAVRLAEEAGLTLIGFARHQGYTVYAHANRLTHNASLPENPMELDYLVKMANDIGNFFSAEPDPDSAATGVANHIKSFWDPRMRKAIIDHLNSGGEGLTDIVKRGVANVAQGQ